MPQDPPQSPSAALRDSAGEPTGEPAPRPNAAHAVQDDETAPWLQILAQDPGRADAHRALWGVYRRRGEEDAAQTELSALCFLRQATSDEVALRDRGRVRLHRSEGALSDDAWIGCLYRSDQSRLLSAISAVVSGPLALRRALEAKRYGLLAEERRAAAGDQTLFGHIFAYAAKLLGVPAPDLYYRPDERAALRLANISAGGRLQPAVVVGQPLLSGVSERELAFRCAVFLAKLRPEHLLRLLLPTLGELRAVLHAALGLASGTRSGDAVVDAYRDQLREALPAVALERLQLLHQREATHGPVTLPDEGAWVQAVDGTAQRAGLVACGDLDLALQVLAREPAEGPGAPLPTIDRQRDLLRYAASPRYRAARKFLGF